MASLQNFEQDSPITPESQNKKGALQKHALVEHLENQTTAL
jgi:hypothetical protein